MMCLVVFCALLQIALCSRSPQACPPHKQEFWAAHNDNNQWKVTPGKGGIADLIHCIQVNETGWNFLEITTDGSASDELQAFASGFVEGAKTVDGIWNTYLSYQLQVSQDVLDFIAVQTKWVTGMANANKASSPYWKQVSLVLAQMDGLFAGYNQYAPPSQSLDYIHLVLLNLDAELGDIQSHVQPSSFDPNNMNSHCSVIVKVSDDKNNLLATHTTWTSFSQMLRTYKTYTLNFNSPGIAASGVSFSSYPGSLQSTDDFYLTTAELVVMETTNEVMNMSLFADYVTPQTVPQWIRIIVANRMAASGKDWAQTYALYNSGTYNNQWQVVDYKLFTPGQPLQPGTLWILEQIPGFVVSADKTDVLRSQGYWPSYNVPYFPFIYNISGYPAYYKSKGDTFSYEHCARANIFRRDHNKVQDLTTLKKLIRYNQYQTDPLSLQDACRGIAARCDLNVPWNSNNTLNGWNAFGAIDAKAVDYSSVVGGSVEVVSGPTWDNQPPFAWTDTWSQVPHYGQPEVFNFEWLRVSKLS